MYVEQGQYEKAAQITREAIGVTPDKTGYANLANCTLALQQLDETKKIIHDGEAIKGPDDFPVHESLYALAFLTGDSAGMAQQHKWFASSSQFENFGLSLASDTAAYAGHLDQARELTRQAVDAAVRADDKENGAIWEALDAQREAAYGLSHRGPNAWRQQPSSSIPPAPASKVKRRSPSPCPPIPRRPSPSRAT